MVIQPSIFTFKNINKKLFTLNFGKGLAHVDKKEIQGMEEF